MSASKAKSKTPKKTKPVKLAKPMKAPKPARKAPPANGVESFTGRKRIRVNFGRIQEVAEMPNLIEVQRNS